MADGAFLPGDRIDLRPIEEDDLEFLQAGINDPVVWRAIGHSKPINRDQEREFYEDVVCDEESVQLLIVADSTPVGTIGLSGIDWVSQKAEVGYWVAPEHHREGYATEATALLVAYGFDQLGLHRIEARVFEFNDPSRRLLEAVGFTREGIHRDAAFVDGEYQDVFWYGLLEDDWRADGDTE